jgi:hypothetical protein
MKLRKINGRLYMWWPAAKNLIPPVPGGGTWIRAGDFWANEPLLEGVTWDNTSSDYSPPKEERDGR